MNEVKITIVCEDGFIADSLRELAIAIEDSDEDFSRYESECLIAEIER